MMVFLAGATGVMGSRLVPLLVAAGHSVAGLTRSEEKADRLRAQGATPVVADVYDLATLQSEMLRFSPDAVLHQLSDLPDNRSELAKFTESNARIRVEGTQNLLAAAHSANARRFLAQSVAWEMPPGRAAVAVAHLERMVLEFGGTVLRYGQFYGPATYHPDSPPGGPRVHIDAAALATLAALESATGVLTVVES